MRSVASQGHGGALAADAHHVRQRRSPPRDSNACRYYRGALPYRMMRRFAARDTERLFARTPPRRWPTILPRIMRRKLLMVDAARALEDLRIPPGTRLAKLRGDRAGQHSVRLNDQWRSCFRWRDGGARDVAIVDHHWEVPWPA